MIFLNYNLKNKHLYIITRIGMTTNFDYYAFHSNTIVNSIKTEIDFYEQLGLTKVKSPIKDYCDYLTTRITLDKPDLPTMTIYDMTGNSHEIKKMNPDEYTQTLDIIMFRKPWPKLREFHKIMKIKEYCDKLPFESKKHPVDKKTADKNKDDIVKQILEGLKNKRFAKNKSEITYDMNQMQITKISAVVKGKNGLYVIDWDE